MSRFVVGAGSDVGRGRPANEDSYLVDDTMRLYAVADGMGGHRAGEVASATAIETLVESFGAGQPMALAVSDANAAVYAKAATNPEMQGMGTTLTVLSLADDAHAVLGHVGDSRAYRARGGVVSQVTEDHSLVEQLVREGRLGPEDALHHPQRAIITRALGVDSQVQVDIYEIDLEPGDRVLLCSDGLTNMVSDESIAEVLRSHDDPQAAVTALIERANAAGGDDNITAVLVDMLDEEPVAMLSEASDTALPEEVADIPPPAVPPAAAELAPPEPEPPAPGPPPDQVPAARRISRLALWLLPILLIVGGAFAAVGVYARRTFYVGLSGDKVALFRGVPGGLLGWDPTVEDTSPLEVSDLTPADRADLEEGHRFSNREKATRFLERLEAKSSDTEAGESPDDSDTATSTTGTGSTTTTSP